jgi:hypothetical protein
VTKNLVWIRYFGFQPNRRPYPGSTPKNWQGACRLQSKQALNACWPCGSDNWFGLISKGLCKGTLNGLANLKVPLIFFLFDSRNGTSRPSYEIPRFFSSNFWQMVMMHQKTTPWFYKYSLRPILLFVNTDVSIIRMCLDTSVLAKSIMGRRKY